MDEESYFTVEGNEWQQQSYYEYEDHPAIEKVKFIRKPKFKAMVFWGWLSANQYFSDPTLRCQLY
jgi:hypothetical protein